MKLLIYVSPYSEYTPAVFHLPECKNMKRQDLKGEKIEVEIAPEDVDKLRDICGCVRFR